MACFNDIIEADDTLIRNSFQFIKSRVKTIQTSTYSTQQKQQWIKWH